MPEYTKCNLCGSSETKFLFQAADYEYYPNEKFCLVKCPDCGLVFINPRPNQAEMAKYYPLEYHREYGPGRKDWQFLRIDKTDFTGRLKKNPGKILDIGCQKGYFLKSMQDRGWQTYGADISDFACAYARDELGLEHVYSGDLLNMDFAPEYFDLVTLWESLEHLHDPLATLKKARQIIKNDGYLIIECPNFSSFSSRLFKEKWYSLQPSRHLYHFSPATLSRMLSEAGFRVVKIDHWAQFLMGMVDLKINILRWLKLYSGLEAKPQEGSGGIAILRREKIIWLATREIFNFFCFILAGLCAFLSSAAVICIIARPKNKKKR